MIHRRRVYDLPMAAGSLRIAILGLLVFSLLDGHAAAAGAADPAHT
jgi:hypothetical protein